MNSLIYDFRIVIVFIAQSPSLCSTSEICDAIRTGSETRLKSFRVTLICRLFMDYIGGNEWIIIIISHTIVL